MNERIICDHVKGCSRKDICRHAEPHDKKESCNCGYCVLSAQPIVVCVPVVNTIDAGDKS